MLTLNNYTNEEIYEKVSQRINYEQLSRILEHDLNHIADVTSEEGKTVVQFKVFFDSAEFNTTVGLQHEGEGQPQLITPVLISLVSGNYSEPKGPQIFNTTFRIEAFGFAEDKERLREIFELYSSLNQGAILTGLFSSSLTTSFTDFPIMTPPEPYKGMDRLSVFMVWNLNFIYAGQLSNDVKVFLDDDPIDFTAFAIQRERIGDAEQRVNEDEELTIQKSQILTFSGSMVYDGSDAAKEIIKSVKNLGYSLENTYELKISYPEVEQEDTYLVSITGGRVSVIAGGLLELEFSMVLSVE